MERADIEQVVCAFLEIAKDDERPFRQLQDLIALLKSQGWTEADIRNVQDKVFMALCERRKPTQ